MESFNVLVSQVFGSLSIALWVVVLVPQIWLNAKRKSCHGVSLSFYLMWSLGDAFNLAGALMQGLILTAILLPLYYIATDIIVLSQFYVYRNNKPPTDNDEEAPLITDSDPSARDRPQRYSTLLLVFFAAAAVLIAFLILAEVYADEIMRAGPRTVVAQVCGYLSALVYLGAYVPQIYQNYRSKSTEGLSMAMFVLVILANLTYCLSILTAHELSKQFLSKYAAWLLGAAGTVTLEFIILYQFYIYRC